MEEKIFAEARLPDPEITRRGLADVLNYAKTEAARQRRLEESPVKHIRIDQPRFEMRMEQTERKTYIESQIGYIIKSYEEKIDTEAMNEIVDIAKAAGVSDVILLDKQKIVLAITKQISQPPKNQGDDLVRHIYCPCCGYFFGNGMKSLQAKEPKIAIIFNAEKHCRNCGQALDWSDYDC